MATADRNPVDTLAEEFTARYRRGERPSVAEYAERHPEFAREINELFPSIALIEDLGSHDHAAQSSVPGMPSFLTQPIERLGDFRIIREIGRGGMGVVFEAEQESLGRHVAVKILTGGAVSSPQQLERFRREAQAAASLHHTNIVPVFGAGEYDGHHYYVMQLIDGVGLDRLIESSDLADTMLQTGTPQLSAGHTSADGVAASSESNSERPDPENVAATEIELATDSTAMATQLDWKQVVHLGQQLADALHYAHSQHVLHRDIKPSNVLVDKQHNAWLADFGLAKHVEQRNVTKTGDIVGTLRYMAPEQFNGTCDARSDIYSLGITLHEVLAREPAFRGNSHGELVARITSHGPPSLRSIRSEIPRDLETIVQKATAHEPHRRYQTAGELADDLERLLADRPIHARRVTALEKTWRWSRRNPALAVTSALSLLLLVLVAATASVGNIRTNRALAEVKKEKAIADDALLEAQKQKANADTALQKAREAQQRADENVVLAIQAFEDIIKKISARGLPQTLEFELEEEAELVETEITTADAELLASLLTFFDEFAQRSSEDLRSQTAEAYRRVGQIRQRLGQFDEAEAAFQKSLEIYDQLAQAELILDNVLNHAGVLRELAATYARTGRHSAASDLYRQAIQLFEQQPLEIQQQKEARFAKVATYLEAASLRTPSSIISRDADERPPSGSFSERWRRDRRPEGERRPRPEGPPPEGPPPPGTPPEARPPDGSPARPERGPLPPPPGPPPELAERDQDQNQTARTATESPRSERRSRGRGYERSRELYDSALAELQRLIEAEPKNTDYQLALARCYRAMSNPGRRGPSEADDEASFARAIEILEALVAQHPDVADFRYELADSLLLAPGSVDGDAANAAYREGVERARQLAADLTSKYTRVDEYQALLAGSLRKLGALEVLAEEFDSAEAHFREAIAHFQNLVNERPAVAIYQIALAKSYVRLGELLRDRNRLAESRTALQEGVTKVESFAEQVTARPGSSSFYIVFIANDLYGQLAETLEKDGDLAAAEAMREKIQPLWSRSGRRPPPPPVPPESDKEPEPTPRPN